MDYLGNTTPVDLHIPQHVHQMEQQMVPNSPHVVSNSLSRLPGIACNMIRKPDGSLDCASAELGFLFRTNNFRLTGYSTLPLP